MGENGPLDALPLPAVFALTLVLVLLAVEGGYRLGLMRGRGSDPEKEAPVGAMVGASLGLLAFLLAFTFGLAASRFDTRKQLVLKEANSVGTTYLRAAMLAEPHRTAVRNLLREYVAIRLKAAQRGDIRAVVAQSEEIQSRLWEHAVSAGEAAPTSIVVGLFVQSLNETIGDLDRPSEGSLVVSQKPLEELLKSFAPAKP